MSEIDLDMVIAMQNIDASKRERSDYCQASSDGEECSHPNCPQKKHWQNACPLKWREDEEI